MTHPTCVRVMFRLRATLEHRPVAVDLVSTLLVHVPTADRAFRNEMITAFGEAFNNVCTHGYRGRSDGMLDVEAEITSSGMTLRLSDNGLAVDFASVTPPDLDSIPEGGMGIFIIHSMVDEVAYQGGDPNVLTLIKRMPSAPAGGLAGPENR